MLGMPVEEGGTQKQRWLFLITMGACWLADDLGSELKEKMKWVIFLLAWPADDHRTASRLSVKSAAMLDGDEQRSQGQRSSELVTLGG